MSAEVVFQKDVLGIQFLQGVDLVKLACQRGGGRGPISGNVHESLDSATLTPQSNVWLTNKKMF